MTVEEMKTAIFQQTNAQKKIYLRTKEAFGTYHEWTNIEHAKYCVLYDIIDMFDFEDEYFEWLKKMKEEEK